MKKSLQLGFAFCLLWQGFAVMAAEKPNVLFIAVDDLNDWVGCLGGNPQAITPNIDKLASESQVFTKAYCAAPLCGPSRTAVMYGVNPGSIGAYGHEGSHDPRVLLPKEVLPLPQNFQQNGYRTAGAGKIFHIYRDSKFPKNASGNPQDDRGWDSFLFKDDSLKANKKSPDYNGQHIAFGPVDTKNDSDLSDGKYTDYVIEQLKNTGDKPFFLALGLKKPHMPWNAPQKYFDMYDLDKIKVPEVPEHDLDDLPPIGRYMAEHGLGAEFPEGGDHAYMTSKPLLWQRAVRAYLATCSYADANIGRMLDALKQSGQYENTIIVLWSDHGWHLGEKNHWRKHALWETSTRTTFIVRAPGLTKAGARCEQVVSLLDIYPTLSALCQLSPQKLEGESLLPLLKDAKASWDKPALMTFGPGNHAIRYGEWRYIQYMDGSEELYHQANDPEEYYNIASNPENAPILAKLKAYIPDSEAVDPAGKESTFEALKSFIKK
jgi:arylsulfatase A-like enzyme